MWIHVSTGCTEQVLHHPAHTVQGHWLLEGQVCRAPRWHLPALASVAVEAAGRCQSAPGWLHSSYLNTDARSCEAFAAIVSCWKITWGSTCIVSPSSSLRISYSWQLPDPCSWKCTQQQSDGLCLINIHRRVCMDPSGDTVQAWIWAEGVSFLEIVQNCECVLLVTCLSCICHVLVLLASVVVYPCQHLHGIESSHVNRCSAIIPRPLVRPPLVFILISTCSMMRSMDRPAHRRSLPATTWNPIRIVWYFGPTLMISCFKYVICNIFNITRILGYLTG